MSDLTQLIEGKMSPSAFVAKESAAIEGNPFFRFLAPLAIEALQVYLSTKIGPTAAGIIGTDLEAVLAGNPSALTGQAEAALSALILGVSSGQSGSKTGAQVETAVQSAASATPASAT